MANEKEIQEKVAELQLLQQRLQVFLAQKQQLQLQSIEIESALKELKKTKKPAYQLVGELLIEKKSADLEKELNERKSDIELRIKTLEKQESKIKDKAQDLQKDLAQAMK
jgi:prefoldin beta subunit